MSSSDPFDTIGEDFAAHLDDISFDATQPASTASKPTQPSSHSPQHNTFEDEDPFADSFGQVSNEEQFQREQSQPSSSLQLAPSNLDNTLPTSDSNAHTLVQAALEDICDRQLLYIRGKRAIVTCIDFPLIFWRYIDVEVEKYYVENFLRSDLAINVNPDHQSLSPHFYQVTLSAYDMGKLVSTSEFHRSFQASPSIFQISLELQQQLRAMMQQPWNWPNYEGHDHSQLLDTGDDDDWADFTP